MKMFSLASAPIYLAREPIDMRKSIDGLSIWVSQVLGHDPLQGQVFVFTNRRRDKIKLLQWDRNGFWLSYKRLERSRFSWPVPELGQQVLSLEARQLQWLLEGLGLEQPRAFQPVRALRVA